MAKRTKDEVLSLVLSVKCGNEEAFRDLERVAKPLLVSLSYKFAGYHQKFEYDDFYSLAQLGLYNACISFNEGNPSFLHYAKVVIIRSMWREVEYWNQGKRNIFNNTEVSMDGTQDLPYPDELDDLVFIKEFRRQIVDIIDKCFDNHKSRILNLYFSGEKVCDIANQTGTNYKSVHNIIKRGTEKIEKEYKKRFIS